ncbi:hypothetical protein BM528_15650 [Alteromonas sp. RW2A1]|uniref:hypothetical protein n=1 Tax=Alteromonas sp. RW2A1 TaxID=1917158 RepID=UPI00090423EA|nr:hypothetical protein [Alteromonas sp. RW2A1]APE07036.1 hypothetical protein BM528_15650 [Alteromonas sp. RW2A1]
MNINNVIRALRQARKTQPISIYCKDAKPCVPADRSFFDEITPVLKLLLKAFKVAGFTAHVSRWGELALHSPTLCIEILIRISPNINYMNRVSAKKLEDTGYEVVEVEPPRKPFIVSYFFNGTASKWRYIPFDNEFVSVESAYTAFIAPMLKTSKPFQGRLQTSLLQKKNESLPSESTFYAFARYAAIHINKTYGLSQVSEIVDKKFVHTAFFGSYGALLLTHDWHGATTVIWHDKDRDFLAKYIPEILAPYAVNCPSISQAYTEDTEHQFLLGSLDKALLDKYGSVTSAENWLEEKHYFTDKKPPKELIQTSSGVMKLLTFAKT